MRDRRRFVSTLLVTPPATWLASQSAWASDPFPSKPVKIVVAFTSGTGSDTIARVLAPSLEDALKTPVIVDNRAGAGGVIGTEYVARSAPDGYTITMGSVSTLATTPFLNPVAKYSFDRDFVAVAGVGKGDYMFVVSAEPGAPKTLAELIARLKKEGGTYGSAGVGTITHLGSEVLLSRAGVKATHVPYKGSGAVMTDLIAGNILFACDSPGAAGALIKAGKLRGLASTGLKRVPTFPDMPTVEESGYPGFKVLVWLGLAGPKDMPADVQKKLSDAVFEVLNRPAVRDAMIQRDWEPMPMSGPDFQQFVSKEAAFWKDLIAKADIKIES